MLRQFCAIGVALAWGLALQIRRRLYLPTVGTIMAITAR